MGKKGSGIRVLSRNSEAVFGLSEEVPHSMHVIHEAIAQFTTTPLTQRSK